jgi:UV DNA damage endonuclease
MDLEIKPGEAINAAEHVWGYFKVDADESEKRRFMKSLEKYKSGKASLGSVKNQLYFLAKKYDSAYLLESYYFI